MGSSVSSAQGAAKTAQFTIGPEVRVIGPDDRDIEPGSGQTGVLALGGRNPVGYYKDEAKSAATFRMIDAPILSEIPTVLGPAVTAPK